MKSQHSPAFPGISLLMLVFLSCAIIISCSKKNDEAFIKTEEVIITGTDVNGCTVNSGGTGTQFSYKIPYTASPGITIEKVEWKAKFSDGNMSAGEYDVNENDGNVNGLTCIRFGASTWNERTYTLVASSGIKSNPVNIKINKPAGAQ